jgi:hypothetical protein
MTIPNFEDHRQDGSKPNIKKVGVVAKSTE